MPTERRSDQDLREYVRERATGEERAVHEQEPLGFEEQMPGPVGSVPEEDPRFRPEVEAFERAVYRGLPRHEGYALDAAAHDRRRRGVFVGAGVFTAALAIGWLVALRAAVLAGPGTPAGESVSEVRARVAEQFGRISARLGALAPTSTAATNAAAAASLQGAIDALSERLASTSTVPTPR